MVRQRLIAVQLLDECITSAWNFEVCTELSTDRLGGGGGGKIRHARQEFTG